MSLTPYTRCCPLCGEEVAFSKDDGVIENGELCVGFRCTNETEHSEACYVQILMEPCVLRCYAAILCESGIETSGENNRLRCLYCGSLLDFVFEYSDFHDSYEQALFPFYECTQEQHIWCVKVLCPNTVAAQSCTKTFMEELRLEVGDGSRMSAIPVSDRQLHHMLTWLLQHGFFM